MNEILTFTIISLFLVISPGPNSVLIVKTVSRSGKKAGIENILGLVSATFIHGAISVFGLSAIILQSAQLFMLIKLIGAAYLLYLGLKTIYGTFQSKNELNNLERTKNTTDTAQYKNFIEGFLTQILNPKVSMFYLAAFPQFVNFENHDYFGAFILVSIHASIIFFWFLGLSICLSKIKSVSGKNPLNQWIQRISGCILVYFSGLLVIQEGSK